MKSDKQQAENNIQAVHISEGGEKKKYERRYALSKAWREKEEALLSSIFVFMFVLFFQPSLRHKHKSNPLYILSHSVNYSHSLNPKIEIQQKQTNVLLIKKKKKILHYSYVIMCWISSYMMLHYCSSADSAQRKNRLLMASVRSPFNNNNELVNKRDAV